MSRRARTVLDGAALERVEAICVQDGVPLAAILGRTRVPRVVRTRHRAWFARYDEFGWSYPEIGAAFGRDHVTVMVAVKAVGAELEVGWRGRPKPGLASARGRTLERTGT